MEMQITFSFSQSPKELTSSFLDRTVAPCPGRRKWKKDGECTEYTPLSQMIRNDPLMGFCGIRIRFERVCSSLWKISKVCLEG